MMTAPDLPINRGILLSNEPMSKHTSWRVGGGADQFYTPADIEDLAAFISALPEQELVVFIGLGSNLLVRDKGIRGTVISLQGSLSEIDTIDESSLSVGAGVSCAKLARFCHRNDLLGGEFFAGIPGLVGGALAMNAGAFGGDTWSLVSSVITVDRRGLLHTRMTDDFEISYRTVKNSNSEVCDEWFVGANLKFEKGSGEDAARRVKTLLDSRNKSQPVGLPSCGSVFKNPQDDYAARLIEASGLKGVSIGGAVVSEKHANFIINAGGAKAADIEDLIQHVQARVKDKQGVDLQTEVRVIGERQ